MKTLCSVNSSLTIVIRNIDQMLNSKAVLYIWPTYGLSPALPKHRYGDR